MEDNKKETAPEVPVQEQSKVLAFSYELFQVIKERKLTLKEFDTLLSNLRAIALNEVKVQ